MARTRESMARKLKYGVVSPRIFNYKDNGGLGETSTTLISLLDSTNAIFEEELVRRRKIKT